ncbi:MAG: DNA replication and repair protein RecF [bacterium]|nr:DNA replication and repair protein RecF [bacterium]MDD5755974.1 DNA replication and repair protein RecF [bacterium]
MYLKTLALQDIRNYPDLKIDFQPGLNIILGANAAGKSNLLEAIFFLHLGRSLRVFDEQEMLRWGQPEGYITAEIANAIGTQHIGIRLAKDQEKKIQINKKNISSPRGLRTIAPAVMLSSKDGELISGEPVLRRGFLNQLLIQIEAEYSYRLLKLKRVILSRNEILKQIRDERQNPDSLDIWNQQLQKEADYITGKRRQVITTLQETANQVGQSLNPDPRREISLEYKTNCPEDETNWPKVWLMIQQEEIKQARTLIGPQRDDVEVIIDKGEGVKNLRLFGSQGEQTLTAYILRLSQAKVIEQEQQQRPLILADDIFAEIDAQTQGQMVQYLRQQEQVFLAATDRERIKDIADPKTLYQAQNNTCSRIV